jgi:hypothetical protein
MGLDLYGATACSSTRLITLDLGPNYLPVTVTPEHAVQFYAAMLDKKINPEFKLTVEPVRERTKRVPQRTASQLLDAAVELSRAIQQLCPEWFRDLEARGLVTVTPTLKH